MNYKGISFVEIIQSFQQNDKSILTGSGTQIIGAQSSYANM